MALGAIDLGRSTLAVSQSVMGTLLWGESPVSLVSFPFPGDPVIQPIGEKTQGGSSTIAPAETGGKLPGWEAFALQPPRARGLNYLWPQPRQRPWESRVGLWMVPPGCAER